MSNIYQVSKSTQINNLSWFTYLGYFHVDDDFSKLYPEDLDILFSQCIEILENIIQKSEIMNDQDVKQIQYGDGHELKINDNAKYRKQKRLFKGPSVTSVLVV